MIENQVGRSMIEMLGVLSIIGVLSVGGFSMVKKMQNSYDTNKVMEEISGLVRKGRTVIRQYDSSTDGSNLNTYVYNGRAYPDGVEYGSSGFTGTAGVVYSFAYGGASTVSALFNLTISSLPEDICMQIATADWGNSASSGFKGLTIDGGNVLTSAGLGDAADKCKDNVSIVMYYK